ncbi:hypothetical protein ACLOJK_013032 [Asimina triloba]
MESESQFNKDGQHAVGTKPPFETEVRLRFGRRLACGIWNSVYGQLPAVGCEVKMDGGDRARGEPLARWVGCG